MDILIKLMEGGRLPTKALPKCVCFDAFVAWMTQDKDLITIGLGFATEMPDGVKGCIVPRSGITKYKVVMQNSPAQIEPDYRGEWLVKFRVINRTFWQWLFRIYPNPFLDSTKAVCQIYFDYVVDVSLKLTNELTTTERGSGGFGHTDKLSTFYKGK